MGISDKCGPAPRTGAQPLLLLLLTFGLVTPHRSLLAQGLSAVWAHDGGDKVAREETRATLDPTAVHNRVWDGRQVYLFGARNETVAFELVLETAGSVASGVTVTFDPLIGPGGATIASTAASGNGVFDWTERPVELFYVRYLQIRGLSLLTWETYDERHVPERMRRPWTGEGQAAGTWEDRPDHDRFYPDIAVPLELVGAFDVGPHLSQVVWVDIWIPPDAPVGRYTGLATVAAQGAAPIVIPVRLEVLGFALPAAPTAGTMVYLGYGDINLRYVGEAWPSCGTPEAARSELVRQRHFQLAHRHRVALIDSNEGACPWDFDEPYPTWLPALSGQLFASAFNYGGPGAGVGNGVFSIGTYGSWSWQGDGQVAMNIHTDAWETWFATNSPTTERFLYLIDESNDYPQIEQWASWMHQNPGQGHDLLSMATAPLPEAQSQAPSLDVPTSSLGVGITDVWQAAADSYRTTPGKRLWLYNGSRPSAGTFALEDDGVALRVTAWAQFKQGVQRWFYWESTYYDNFQGGTGQTDVFSTAHTFGGYDGVDSVLGETGWNYTNGDGVLFYPGTDTVFPASSYGVDGPFASLRLKQWRRGLQDHDYLALAHAVDPAAVDALVQAMVPEVLWEYGVQDPGDPTWVLTDIGWTIDPDVWEDARCSLAQILDPAAPCTPVLFEDGFESGDTGHWSSVKP